LIGEIYVNQTFGAEGKARTLAMVDALEKALRGHKSLPWMGEETKKQSRKAAAITNRIGYTTNGVTTRNSKSFARCPCNSQRSNQNTTAPPQQNGTRSISATAVSAHDRQASYNPCKTTSLPAGILQPPFTTQCGRRYELRRHRRCLATVDARF